MPNRRRHQFMAPRRNDAPTQLIRGLGSRYKLARFRDLGSKCAAYSLLSLGRFLGKAKDIYPAVVENNSPFTRAARRKTRTTTTAALLA